MNPDRLAFHVANKRCVELMDEVEKLRDLIRWRSRWDEPPPAVHGIYLVIGFNFDMKRRIWVAKFDGKWPDNLAVDYWRPIGPLPGEGGE